MSPLAVVKKDGLAAIAADSLTSARRDKDSAQYVANHQKILVIGESYLGVSGPTSAKLALQDYFAGRGDCDFSSVEAIYRVWLELHRVLKSKYFLNPNEDDDDAFESTRIDVLIANPHGIFGVAAHRAVQEFTQFYAYGTGAGQALGAMYVAYSLGGTSPEDVARIGVEAAAQFDLNTSLPAVS